MHIVTAPHSSLRRVADPVTTVDTKFRHFLSELGETLVHKAFPNGVGLAAPQIDRKWRVFATNISKQGDDDQNRELHFYINPRIVKTSKEQELGPDDKNTVLEGCLSIPRIFGPVPRFRWIELEFEIISEDQLITKSERFHDFPARLVQHELDHLDGILFTDYSLDYNLPLYTEQPDSDKLVEIQDRSIIEIF